MNLTNWKTTLSGTGAAITSALTVLAALPYQLGDLATIIPPEWKIRVVLAGLFATTLLRIINSIVQKDAPQPQASTAVIVPPASEATTVQVTPPATVTIEETKP